MRVNGSFIIVNTITKEEHPQEFEDIDNKVFDDLIDELEYLGYLIIEIKKEEN